MNFSSRSFEFENAIYETLTNLKSFLLDGRSDRRQDEIQKLVRTDQEK